MFPLNSMVGGVIAVGGWKLDVITLGNDSDGVAMEIVETFGLPLEILVRSRASQRHPKTLGVHAAAMRSNQQKAALEHQKAAMEHDLEAGSCHCFVRENRLFF